MADGIICVYCGWQSSDHELGGPFGDRKAAAELKPGKMLTLDQCNEQHGYTPENPKLAKRLAEKAAKENAEQEMRRRRLGVPCRGDED